MGNNLWSACSGESAVMSDLCLGYVMGIADAMGGNIPILGFLACIPMPLTNLQALDVVKKHLEQHPEERHLVPLHSDFDRQRLTVPWFQRGQVGSINQDNNASGHPRAP